ncbi:MAG: Crp/Fnr family transcriptional regulator [Nitrospirae bacterium]|nr:Crp/Fnr family transcriptional regulator [Nitrospirota bacterium]
MLIKYLKDIPIFNHLNESHLKEIALRCRSVSFKKGDVVFHMTSPSTDLYVVLQGKLKAERIDEEGAEIVLSHFEQGDFFGELSLIDAKGRSATIVAEEASELAILRRDVFLELLLKDSKIAVELIVTLADRLRKADEMIESLAFLAVGERLLKSLIEIGRHEGKAEKGFIRVSKLTHKDLASRIGASREAVSKCMKTFASKGIIKESEGYILISDDISDKGLMV